MLAHLMLLCAGPLLLAEPLEWITVRPADSGAGLLNPGMGWVFHHYDNSPDGYGPPLGPTYDGREFPGLSVVYLRLAWSHLEPEEGRYAWPMLDTVIQRYAAAGKRFAFRFTAFEGVPDQGTPEWVRSAGARGFEVETYGIRSWEPDYDDPVFLDKLGAFLRAAGARYDAAPGLEFVDVGTLGIWGEGHPIAHDYPPATARRHIELHREAFPHALLVAQDDWARWFREEGRSDTYALDMAREMGLAFRDDSICVYADPTVHYSAALAQPFWPATPNILEMGHYGYAKSVGAWGGERYLQAVEDYHGSYASIHADPREFLAENADLIRRINLRLGYRLLPGPISWPASHSLAEPLPLRSEWRNVGVAPCLPGGRVAWWLLGSDGSVAATFVEDAWDVRELAPDGKPLRREAIFALPRHLAAGTYQLRVSVGRTDGTPTIALPLPDGDERLRYALGEIALW